VTPPSTLRCFRSIWPTRAREERNRLGDVFGEHGDAELRSALVEGLEFVLADAVVLARSAFQSDDQMLEPWMTRRG